MLDERLDVRAATLESMARLGENVLSEDESFLLYLFASFATVH